MASTYVNDLRLNEMATGDASGTWGEVTNTNLELIAEAFSYGTEAITTNADTHTTTIADGATDPGRSMYLKYTGTLDSACTITIGPNTVSKMWFIENATSGSQNIIISQGSGANITIPPGDVKVVYSDGAGSGAAVVDAFASLSVVDLKVQDDLTVTDDMTVGGTLGVTGVLTATSLDISGDIDVDGTTNLDVVDIDGAVDMASTLNVSGNITGTLGTAAQPNITSLGTLTTLTVDDITINGSTISDSGTLTIDAGSDLKLDADSSNIYLADGGTDIGLLSTNNQDLNIRNLISDKDIYFQGNDGGSTITALTLDMSAAGEATFNDDINLGDSKRLRMGAGGDFEIFHDGSNNYIKGASSDQDIIFQGVDGGSAITALTLDMSAAGAATFNSDVGIGATPNTYSGYTTLTLGSSSNGGLIDFERNGTIKGEIFTEAAIFGFQTIQADDDIVFKGNDGGSTITALTLDMSAAGAATFNAGATFGGNLLLDVDNAEINLKSGVGGTSGAINWTFNTSSSDFASIKLPYDTRASTGLHIDSGYPITIDASSSGDYAIDFSIGGTLEHRFNSTGVVFNELSADRDFRVESNGNANMLFVDGGNDAVGIGTNSPLAGQLQVNDGSGARIAITRTSGATSGDLGTIRFGNTNVDSNLVNIVAFQDGATDSAALKFETQATGAATAERLRISSRGAIGFGTTPPSDTHTGWNQFFIGQKASLFSENATGTHGLDGTFITDNLYVDSDTGSFANIETNESSAYRQEGGEHLWYSQSSGSAGAAVSLSEKMKLNDGVLTLTSNTPNITFIESDASNKQYQVGSFGAAFAVYDASLAQYRYIIDAAGNHIFNEGSADTDFRVESNGSTHMLFVDGGNDSVNIAGNADQSKGNLVVSGSANSAATSHRPAILSRGSFGGGIASLDTLESGWYQLTNGTVWNLYHARNTSSDTPESKIVQTFNSGETVFNEKSRDLDFRVESDAHSHALFVDAGANSIGMFTTSLGTEATLHIGIPSGAGNAEGGQLILQSSVNGSKAFHMDNYNNASVDYCRFMRGTDTTSELVLGAWDITNVSYLVGKGADVNTDTGVTLRADGGARFTSTGTSSFVQLAFFRNGSASEVGSITTTSSGTNYNQSSDYRLKENVDYTWDATTRLKQLKPARFNFIADETNTLVDGFLAHEVSSVVPEAITGEKDGDRMQGIDQSKLVPLLVKTIQELEARITALES